MKLSVLLVLAELICGWCSPVFSAGRIAIGDGANTCGAWIEERRSDSQRSQLWKGWVLGFVSGANVYDVNPELLRQVDAPVIYIWVDNYCRANPLDTVNDAVVGLIQELMRRNKQNPK